MVLKFFIVICGNSIDINRSPRLLSCFCCWYWGRKLAESEEDVTRVSNDYVNWGILVIFLACD